MSARLLTLLNVLVLLLTIGSFAAGPAQASPQARTTLAAPIGSGFQYQGQLGSALGPISGQCNFQFSLWDSVSGGVKFGATQSLTAVLVSQGRYTVTLNEANQFGPNALSGEARWLEITVECADTPPTTLTPRQPLTPTAYVQYAAKAGGAPWSGVSSVPSGLTAIGGLNCAASQIIKSNGSTWTCAADNDHNHIAQTWLNSTSTTVLKLRNTVGTGLSVYAQGSGGYSGIYSFSESGYGVAGSSDGSHGVLGASTNATSSGVYGENLYGGVGVRGKGNIGVWGFCSGSTGCRGVYGQSSQGYAAYFSGKVHVTGSLSKGGGSFKIDHPLDPENKYLYHSFVESPDMMNIYNGNVTLDSRGEAVVTMPGWFQALNQEFRYQLTALDAPGPNLFIASQIRNNQFKIAGGAPNGSVSWQVTGIRHDPYAEKNRIPVEQDKAPEDRGKYLYPTEYGKAEAQGIDYQRSSQASEQQSPAPPEEEPQHQP
jgi:hypothetical protein